MREILFRAWVEQHVYMAYNIEEISWDECGKLSYVTAIYEADEPFEGAVYKKEYEEILEASEIELMQFTGLKDKNGKMIFEGDVLEFSVFDCMDNDKQFVGVVKYLRGCFLLYVNEEENWLIGWVCSQYDEIKVIGNIYEHKHLLK